MTKEEINEFVEEKFKKIARNFRRAVDNFETENISLFRTEIKKIKVFLRLLSMESEDGQSYHISKRMKTIYGYLGIIKNFQTQLQEANTYQKKLINVPACYVNMLEKELAYWKKNSKNFLDADYDFFNDKQELIATLPDKLTKKSIKKFIHYTLYELKALSGHLTDERIDSARKFMEDIYYNFSFLKPYITEQQTNLFDEKVIGECLELFKEFRDKCMSITLLQTFDTSELDEHEKQSLKQMENIFLHEKEKLKNELGDRLASMHLQARNLKEFAFAVP